MTDLLASWVAPMGAIDPAREPPAARGGVVAGNLAPAMGLFRTSDGGYVVLGVYSEDRLWDALCEGLGLAAHVGLTMEQRESQAEELAVQIASAIVSRFARRPPRITHSSGGSDRAGTDAATRCSITPTSGREDCSRPVPMGTCPSATPSATRSIRPDRRDRRHRYPFGYRHREPIGQRPHGRTGNEHRGDARPMLSERRPARG